MDAPDSGTLRAVVESNGPERSGYRSVTLSDYGAVTAVTVIVAV